ncbi:GNAT family N-acetyltransferase [Aestuariibius sp. HNIBRBA575]|uniref:GNAT family N-acetyltransferase n=1 Tax=Aestuariibius sp. HNIBRBA575 TaxID=3233343 RepID=UPI0034A14F8D
MENTASLALPLQQHPIFGRALTLIGRSVLRVSLGGNAHQIGRAQLIERPILSKTISLASRGPVWRQSVTQNDKFDAYRTLTQSGLRLVNAESPDDRAALRNCGFRQVIENAHLAEIDLNPDIDLLRAQMNGKWRNQLVRGEKRLTAKHLKLEHRAFEPVMDRWLLAEEHKQRRARKYRAVAPEFTLALAEIDADQLRMFVLKKRNQPLAAMLFIKHGVSATYHIGWTSPEGRELRAHQLLLWRAMQDLKSSGIQILDLGQVDTENAPGLARFKLGSGAKLRQLGGTWIRLSPFPA